MTGFARRTACGFSALAALAACSTGPGQASAADGQRAAAQSSGGISVSRAGSYSSLAEAAIDSSAIVIAEPTGARRTVDLKGIPATVSTMRLSRLLAGSSPGSEFGLLQLGTAIVPLVEQSTPFPEPGQSYLLFLSPMPQNPGFPSAASHYIIAGDEGAYRVDGDRAYKFSQVSDALPKDITVEQAARLRVGGAEPS